MYNCNNDNARKVTLEITPGCSKTESRSIIISLTSKEFLKFEGLFPYRLWEI